LFSFFKKRPLLRDLIPDGHIDIHSHLLPGIDDGAATIDDTMALIQGMKDIGYAKFITTPHTMHGVWDNTREGIENKCRETQAEFRAMGFQASIMAASEYMMNGHFSDLCRTGQLLPLKENYVLVEMSYINPPIQLYDILFDMQIAGYKPVLAHPERYAFYHSRLHEYRKLKDAGCLFQINLLSTVCYYGMGTFKTAQHLLRHGMIDFVGSDVHHSKHLGSFNKRVHIKDLAPLHHAIDNTKLFAF
jgi:tyrosine-protein phosphatase YwqE